MPTATVRRASRASRLPGKRRRLEYGSPEGDVGGVAQLRIPALPEYPDGEGVPGPVDPVVGPAAVADLNVVQRAPVGRVGVDPPQNRHAVVPHVVYGPVPIGDLDAEAHGRSGVQLGDEL